MTNKTRKKIIPQMLDVRPVDASGNLDVSLIEKMDRDLRLVRQKLQMDQRATCLVQNKKAVIANTADMKAASGEQVSKTIRQQRDSFEKEAFPLANISGIKADTTKSFRDISNIDRVKTPLSNHSASEPVEKARIYQFGRVFDADEIPLVYQAEFLDHKNTVSEKIGVIKEEAREFGRQDIIEAARRSVIFTEKTESRNLADDGRIQFFERPNDLQDGNRIKITEKKKAVAIPRSFSVAKSRDVLMEEDRQSHETVSEENKIAEYASKKEAVADNSRRILNFSIGERLHKKIVNRIEKGENDLAGSISGMFALTNLRRATFSFSGVAMGILLVVISVGFFNKGLKIRDSILGVGKEAYFDLASAKDGMLDRDFAKSSFEFGEAYEKFENISADLNDLGGIIIPASRYVPYLSKLSSGDNMAQAGKNISRIGILAGEIMQTMDDIKNPLDREGDAVSFLEIFKKTDADLHEILKLVQDTEEKLSKVNVDDIPEGQRVQFVELRSKLPQVRQFMGDFLESSEVMTDVLGGNGPRKYLFLFQNNQEMRATGGFIGTYGIMDIFNGNVRNFFIDGIFNPDGQLREKIVPPVPIQKMSANWSLHDSNWFPDFPKSAEKASWFYEKTGGPTVDGVITMTPNVMQDLLAVTGPITMEEYGVTVDKDNFIETIQQEVEVDYDKKLNQPKKILADLAPKILDRVFKARNFSDIAKTLQILIKNLNEKQILIYSKNFDIERILSQEGWSGEVLNTEKDYLSIINTNINGYKTDGVVDEEIFHQADIQKDGTIIDTVTVKRHHNGGSLEKEWWNKVNADYMRVYVPKGSKLISVEGQTREFNSPPLDYKKLAFRSDPQVRQEEDSMKIDEESGTRVYEDSEKTVFANWVYVSPQETVEITYKYLLPFKLAMDELEKPADTYSLLVQKQSGSIGSLFEEKLTFPDSFKIMWSYPENENKEGKVIQMKTDLKVDRFLGATFTKE